MGIVEKRKAKRASSRRRPRKVHAKSAQPMTIAPRAEATQHTSAAPKGTRQPRNDSFLVVGLGASAGGLEATRKLLAALPAGTGMAFVLIQHLEPSHESMLADLLARDTAMKVVQASDGMPLERNCVYVIPPRSYLAIRGGVLRVSQLQEREDVHLPFDFFLNSLAEEYGERAVCVILSGTGVDGSVGLRAVSEKGGLVIAQDPEEAAFDGMPRSAIATGAVNLVLPTAKIPRTLIRYALHPYVTAGLGAVKPDEQADKSLTAIITLLRTRTPHDFSRYKKTMLHRRVQRRMAAAGIKEIEDYVKILRKDDRELELLARNLLIHVTRFFRDPPAYEALAKIVIPELVREHSEDQAIRVWVPGCSTGEEAYSLAMLFFEELGAEKRSAKLRIFASDVNPDAVAYARNGIYSDSIKTDVSAERLDRFFTHEDQSYRVKRDLRESMVFTIQDLLNDPPFMRLDFISCRNLLIYLQPEEQERALLLFHYALVQGGFLFLGTSETTSNLIEQFEPVPDTLRIFRRIGHSRPPESAIVPNMVTRGRSPWPRLTRQVELKRPSFSDLVQQLLLEAYAPAAVLVNRKYQGLYFFGPTDRYLRVAAGEPSGHLPAMLREGLASKFRAVVRQASQDHATATVSGAQVKRNGGFVTVSISVRPVRHEGEELLLVTFADVPEQKAVAITEPLAEASRVEQLEEELGTTRKDLENTIRDLEASNQELTALNEEAASMNEEFQSTNEELETSREELQSVNEELVRVNSELQQSLEQQRHTNDDLQNILNSSDIATLFLDKNLNIRLFTPATAPLFNLIATDVGRPLADLASRFTGIDLLTDARNVLGNLTPIKRQVKSGSGTWYLCSILPYRTQEARIEGVVISLADISNLKMVEESLHAARAYAEAIVNTVRTPTIVVDDELHVVSANQSFYRLFGAAPEDTVGRLLPDSDAQHLDTPAIRELLKGIKSGSRDIDNFEITIDLPPLGERTLAITAKEIRGASADSERILIAFDDITEFKRTERQLVDAGRASELANLAKSRFLAVASHDLRQPLQSLSFLRSALRQRVTDKEALALIDRADRASQTMAGMLDALLDIDQLETGTIRPIAADFRINELFGELNNEFTEHAKNKGLGWRLIPCGLMVRSDRRLLAEMVRNLLSNAVRYTDEGKILLGCRRHGDRLRIEVWDTGIGISDDQLPRIFEEYHQAGPVTGRQGLGLGLAIVQRLGELLAHPVAVRSRLGKGSVFSIEVPLAGAAPLPMSPPEAPQGAAGAGRAGAILVIEDEASVRESLAAMLRAEGHCVTAAANGQAALDLVARDRLRPDLVISDYNLPGEFNGVQTAVALRSALGWQVPAVILSGDVRFEKQHNIAGSGCVGVTKPVRASELTQLVQRLLAGWQPAAASAAATIFVVDDNRDIREAMRALLSNAGYRVKIYADAQSFLNSHRPSDEGCLIADVRMPGMNGLEMLARLAATGSNLPAIIMTGQGDIAMAVQAMRAGALDFIEKPVDPQALLASIDGALRQAASPAEGSASHAAAAMRVAGLTKREREVMDLVVVGHANKEIAARLGINQRTVETHRAAVMKKMGAQSLSDLVRLDIAARGATGQPTARANKGLRHRPSRQPHALSLKK